MRICDKRIVKHIKIRIDTLSAYKDEDTIFIIVQIVPESAAVFDRIDSCYISYDVIGVILVEYASVNECWFSYMPILKPFIEVNGLYLCKSYSDFG